MIAPDGKRIVFSDYGAIRDGLYCLSNPGGYTLCEGSIDDIYNFLPYGCKVIMKDFPYAMRKVRPYLVNKNSVQLTLF